MSRHQRSLCTRQSLTRGFNLRRNIANISFICMAFLAICPSSSAAHISHVDRYNFGPRISGRGDKIIDYRHASRDHLDRGSGSDVDLLEESLDSQDYQGADDGELVLNTEVKRSSSPVSPSTASASPFPMAFDTSLGNNFTSQSCPLFFSNFLHNSTFISCHAISLLLENSNSFFRASSSATSLDEILQLSCATNATICTTFLSHLASNLINDNACGQDYELGNPLVSQAYEGMIAYQALYRAACLKDPITNEFCFTQSASNNTNVADYYVYFLPLGMPLPGSSRPTCSECLQATMEVFEDEAQYQGQPLTTTYIPAAEQINIGCGPSYANTSVVVGSKSAISAGTKTRHKPNSTFLGYILVFSFGVLAVGIL